MIKKEILKDIKKYIIDNEGISLDIDTMKNTTLKNGYVVSIEGYELKVKNIDDVMKKITKYISIINILKNNDKIKKTYFVGVWYNENDSYYYIDISKHFEKLRDAKNFGKMNKQKAIYNLKNNNSIYLNYNITFYSLYKNDNIITTFDNIKDISNYLKISIKEVYNIINNKINNTSYFIYKDSININEL